MSDKKLFITKEEAISILPDGENIHTFYNGAFGLLGADWIREDIVSKINNVDFIEITGEQAKSMRHGLALYNNGSMQSDVLFVETDMDKLADLEKKKQETEDEKY